MKTRSTTTSEVRPQLIARDAELSLLREKLNESLSSRGSAVFVTGLPGTGKSRLLAEMEFSAADLGIQYVGAGESHEDPGIPFGAFLNGLRVCSSLGSPAEQRNFRTAIEAYDPQLAQLVYPRPRKRSGSSPDTDEVLGARLGVARIANCLLSLSRKQPLVLCFDDFHRADSATISLVAYLTNRIESQALVVVCAMRPRTAGWSGPSSTTPLLRSLTCRKHVELVRLSRMSATDVRQLTEAYLVYSELNEDLTAQICSRSDGYPADVIEQVERARQQGILYEHDGVWVNRRWEVVESEDVLHVDYLLEGLDTEDRSLLESASIQGPVFEGVLVAEALGWPRTSVLRRLVRMQRSTHLLAPAGRCFRFSHGAMADLFYARMPAEKRRQMHLRLLHFMEKAPANRTEALARHSRHAGESAKAVEYLLNASREARQRAELTVARSFLGMGLQMARQLETGPDRNRTITVLLELADVEIRLGEWQDAARNCRETLQLAAPNENRAAQVRALLLMGELHFQRGQNEEAEHLCHDIQFESQIDAMQRAGLSELLARIALGKSQFITAAEHLRVGAELAIVAGDDELLGAIYSTRGHLATLQGDNVQAMLLYTKAMRCFTGAGGFPPVAHGIGFNHVVQKDWPAALENFRNEVELARHMGATALLGRALSSRALAELETRQPETAERTCAAASAYADQARDRRGQAENIKVEGIIKREQGEADRAEELLLRSKNLLVDLQNSYEVAECDRELGHVHQRRGDLIAARRSWQEARLRFSDIGASAAADEAAELIDSLAA